VQSVEDSVIAREQPYLNMDCFPLMKSVGDSNSAMEESHPDVNILPHEPSVSDVEDLDDSIHDTDLISDSSNGDEDTVSEADSSRSSPVKIKKHVADIISSDLFEDSSSIVPSSCFEGETSVTLLPDLSRHLKSQNGGECVLSCSTEILCSQKARNESSLSQDSTRNGHGNVATESDGGAEITHYVVEVCYTLIRLLMMLSIGKIW